MILVCKILNIGVLIFTLVLLATFGPDKFFRDLMNFDVEGIWILSVLISSGLSAYILNFKDHNDDESLIALWTKAKKSELKKKIEN